jgi:hypothetical protein
MSKPRLSRKLLLSKLSVWKGYKVETIQNNSYYWVSPDAQLFKVYLGDHGNLAWLLLEAAGKRDQDPMDVLYKCGFCRVGVDNWVADIVSWNGIKTTTATPAIRKLFAEWSAQDERRDIVYV